MKQPPEAPLSTRDHDALRRWPFAHSIYQLIRNAPKEWSLRIGVFGRWGEGKTTVLNFIEEMAKKEDFPVAKFNPWAAQDRNELWRSFVLSIENAFKAGSFTKAKLKREGERIVKSEVAKMTLKEGLKLTGLGEVADAIGGVLGPLLQERLGLNKSDAEQVLKKNLGDRKLIILLDDLDRANPELVPHLLLGLREILDLQQCAFIMGLDPVVISNALSEVHAGWGRTPEFLEKIIDFPFWLPPVQRSDVLGLVDQELKAAPATIDHHALQEVIHLLPENPRKLKRFLRGLWRFKVQIERHEETETEWIFLLLIELLRAVSFKTAERLFATKELWDELQKSSFVGRMPEEGKETAIKEEKWVEIMINVLDQDKDKDEDQRNLEKEDFLRILNAMKDLISIEKWANLHYWARLDDDPPIVTWKEFNGLFADWKRSPTKANLEKLITSHARKSETSVTIVAGDLFRTVIAYREKALAQAAECEPESELIEGVQIADLCLSMITILISELHGFSGPAPFLVVSDIKRVFDHFSRWAHFTNHDAYVQARAEESRVLALAAKEASKKAEDILEAIKAWDSLIGPMKKEAQRLKDNVIEVLTPNILSDLRDRFLRKDGIDALWGDRHPVLKHFLFRRDEGLYSEEGIRFLAEVVDKAKTDAQVHSNLVQFILMLEHGLTHGLRVLSPSELRPLASDEQIMPLVWRGVVLHRLQPRMTGSFKEVRARLGEFLGGVDKLPVPDWWDSSS